MEISFESVQSYRPLMTFLSYAQNIEDVVLRRPDVEGGFHLDLGAAGALNISVAKGILRGGWSGMNIEPAESDFTALQSERSRNVQANVKNR
jgi:hypothetical protein